MKDAVIPWLDSEREIRATATARSLRCCVAMNPSWRLKARHAAVQPDDTRRGLAGTREAPRLPARPRARRPGGPNRVRTTRGPGGPNRDRTQPCGPTRAGPAGIRDGLGDGACKRGEERAGPLAAGRLQPHPPTSSLPRIPRTPHRRRAGPRLLRPAGLPTRPARRTRIRIPRPRPPLGPAGYPARPPHGPLGQASIQYRPPGTSCQARFRPH
jgi:hypothetical protein